MFARHRRSWRGAVIVLVTLAIAGCQDERTAQAAAEVSVQDSTATVHEVRSSLAGQGAPRGEAYSYRGLYAGLTQGRLEQILGTPAGDSSRCHPEEKPVGEIGCTYVAPLGPDSARVEVSVAYVAGKDTSRIARTITVTRSLPLDVDGVLVASSLADAFERQTTFLDKRDATYGEHRAQVRMGSVNAARLNYVDVTVSPVHGREVLVVKMSRSGSPKVAPAPPHAAPVTASRSPSPSRPAKH